MVTICELCATPEVEFVWSSKDGKDQRMKYRELLAKLQMFDDEQLEQDVTVLDENNDEFYPVETLEYACEEKIDVLDSGHPYLVFLGV
jgi:hypothetical protein